VPYQQGVGDIFNASSKYLDLISIKIYLSHPVHPI